MRKPTLILLWAYIANIIVRGHFPKDDSRDHCPKDVCRKPHYLESCLLTEPASHPNYLDSRDHCPKNVCREPPHPNYLESCLLMEPQKECFCLHQVCWLVTFATTAKFLLTPTPHPKPNSSFKGYISRYHYANKLRLWQQILLGLVPLSRPCSFR